MQASRILLRSRFAARSCSLANASRLSIATSRRWLTIPSDKVEGTSSHSCKDTRLYYWNWSVFRRLVLPFEWKRFDISDVVRLGVSLCSVGHPFIILQRTKHIMVLLYTFHVLQIENLTNCLLNRLASEFVRYWIGYNPHSNLQKSLKCSMLWRCR